MSAPTVDPVPLASSSGGRVSGKAWKQPKTATQRSHLQAGVKTKKWEDRMEREKAAKAIKKLEIELKEEKQAEIQRRREVTLERKKAAEEKAHLAEMMAKMSAKKALRLKRRAGRTKKING
ncbi:hypothetical protein SISNIDRAFT_548079 [Sistotremastrum niveocremeum HHB9708]|uniref:rRNA-processing protein n=2 Tax=Sistotremastraceae TaxID=3402574 RepID=A0A164XG68_9AGAM|nr:hypothetical protein SISNIDRAFT_548079 [Sistotremastrum niveocremeum HHB9708]KZT41331.1 hypothetical protein SISSUDRAFT_1126502 [Sistotremastrum suecicum HHB10207 ss-3]